jgi:hypothetical protein
MSHSGPTYILPTSPPRSSRAFPLELAIENGAKGSEFVECGHGGLENHVYSEQRTGKVQVNQRAMVEYQNIGKRIAVRIPQAWH